MAQNSKTSKTPQPASNPGQNPGLLSISPDEALFPDSDRQVDGMVVAIYQNERPLAGLAGLLDWRLGGEISRFLRSGFITGKFGECVYLPFLRHGQTTHLLLVGAGMSAAPGKRAPLPPESLKELKKNLISLKLPRMGISRADFEDSASPDTFDQWFSHLKGLSLWLVQ